MKGTRREFPGTLKRLYEIGYREVEPSGFGKYTAEEFSRFIKHAGFTAPSAHLPFNTATDLKPMFDDCHALGARYATSSSLRRLGTEWCIAWSLPIDAEWQQTSPAPQSG